LIGGCRWIRRQSLTGGRRWWLPEHRRYCRHLRSVRQQLLGAVELAERGLGLALLK